MTTIVGNGLGAGGSGTVVGFGLGINIEIIVEEEQELGSGLQFKKKRKAPNKFGWFDEPKKPPIKSVKKEIYIQDAEGLEVEIEGEPWEVVAGIEPSKRKELRQAYGDVVTPEAIQWARKNGYKTRKKAIAALQKRAAKEVREVRLHRKTLADDEEFLVVLLSII